MDYAICLLMPEVPLKETKIFIPQLEVKALKCKMPLRHNPLKFIHSFTSQSVSIKIILMALTYLVFLKCLAPGRFAYSSSVIYTKSCVSIFL